MMTRKLAPGPGPGEALSRPPPPVNDESMADNDETPPTHATGGPGAESRRTAAHTAAKVLAEKPAPAAGAPGSSTIVRKRVRPGSGTMKPSSPATIAAAAAPAARGTRPAGGAGGLKRSRAAASAEEPSAPGPDGTDDPPVAAAAAAAGGTWSKRAAPPAAAAAAAWPPTTVVQRRKTSSQSLVSHLLTAQESEPRKITAPSTRFHASSGRDPVRYFCFCLPQRRQRLVYCCGRRGSRRAPAAL